MNDAVNMAAFTAPKTDQANYDDFIAGPRTITITAVKANEGAKEQPISIYFVGDDNKPYKPCLSMRRVMVHVWGPDAKNYIGRSITLYGDPNVVFGGLKVGGIRISHMSNMDKPVTLALTATRSKRAPFSVQPLVVAKEQPAVDVDALVVKYASAADRGVLAALETMRMEVWSRVDSAGKKRLKEASVAADDRLKPGDDSF